MASKKVTQLTAATTPVGADLAMIVTDVATVPASKKITLANLLKQIFLAAGTKLNITTIADGEFLKRSGTDITSSTAGYINIPQNSQSTAYTTVLADAGKHILHPTADNNARTFTIDSNANVPYITGTAITFINLINTVTIAITSDTLILAGTGTTGSRTLAANGVATAVKITSTSWIMSGTGIT